MTHRSTPIYLPSMATTIEDWLTSLREDSRASHIQSQDTDKAKQIREIYGLTHGDLYLRYSRSGSCWKMLQGYFSLWGTETDQHMGAPFLGTLPQWVTTVGLELYRRPTQGLPIFGSGGGLWPTPKASDQYNAHTKNDHDIKRGNLRGVVQQWPTPTVSDTEGGIIKNVEYENGSFSRLNADGVRWGVKLKDAMASTNPEYDQKSNALNPDWVEWLMGLPKGWTSPEPLPEGAWEEWITDIASGTWWDTERDIPRVTTERTNRVKRLKSLGNGIVPRCIPVFLGVVNDTGK